MKKIKLLQMITKLDLGGAQLSTLELIKGLDKDIYEVYLITSDKGILINDIILISKIKLHLLPSLRRESNILYDIKALFDIYNFIRLQNIDIVHTHSSKAGILGRWAAKLAGVRVIIHTVHGWGFHEYQNKIKKYFYIFLEKITAIITDQIITVTEHDISKGLNYGVGNKHKYNLIRYGINKNRFSISNNGSFREKMGVDNGCFVVGMIACFKPQKSPLDFVFSAARVAKYISDVKFVMVGDGQLKDKVVALIERLNLKNKFVLLGWQRKIPEIISSFDVLVLTSLWEGLPIVFLEAMAGRKPIVATNIDGNSEVVDDGVNGFLVNPRDSYVLADRIIYLFKNRNLSLQMGEKGRSFLNKEYELKHMISRIDSFYLSCLKQEGDI
ncbi:MAG: glycosyltransferase family 4 protein [Candidatus Omnitrophica bacterium]|nr:glycosyltransferase family 4 protein [Candidatus Omnitrophota bacterium]